MNVLPKAADAVTFAPITEVRRLLVDIISAIQSCIIAFCFLMLPTHHYYVQELKNFKAYSALRAARADARLVGVRAKKSKEGKDEAAPAAAEKE